MNNDKVKIFDYFIEKRISEFNKIKIKDNLKYPRDKSGQIFKNDNIPYSGCMGSLSRMADKKAKFYFPNAYGVPLDILKKYVKIIINLDSFYSDHMKDIEVSEKGITCTIVSANTQTHCKLNLFLIYFFRVISLEVLKGYAYYVVKGVGEGLSPNESLNASSLCVTGSNNYFCYQKSTAPIMMSSDNKVVKVLPYGIGDLFVKKIKNQKDAIDSIKKDNLIYKSFFEEKNKKKYFAISDFCRSFPLTAKNNFIKDEILSFYRKELRKNDFNLYEFYKKLLEITSKYSLEQVEVKGKGVYFLRKIPNYLYHQQRKITVISKKTKKQKRFYAILKDGSISHLNKKNIKKIIT